jgi:hypothetical protein
MIGDPSGVAHGLRILFGGSRSALGRIRGLGELSAAMGNSPDIDLT